MIHLNVDNFINPYEVQRLEEVIERDECEILGIPNENIHRYYPALTSQYMYIIGYKMMQLLH